jgi:hypothetical protein
VSEEERILHCPLCGEFMLRDYRSPLVWYCPACSGEFKEHDGTQSGIISSADVRACFYEDTRRGNHKGGGDSPKKKRRPLPKKPTEKWTLA